MTPRPTGWNRIVARLRGEIPAAALEAYRRASLPVLELFEQVERRRLEAAIDGVDPWSVPPATRSAFLCAWNAFVLQTLGNEILDADYRGEPATLGYVPPATARQVHAFYESVEGWVNRAYQAQANPDYRLDVPVPARLPAWEDGAVDSPAHLQGLLHALRAVVDHADAALASLPESVPDSAPDAPDRQAQVNGIRQLHASARARARYAEELAGVDPVPEVLARAGAHAREAVEQLYLLGQWIADPALASDAVPEPEPEPPLPALPALPAADGGRRALPASAPASNTAAAPRKTVLPEDRIRQLLALAVDTAASLADRKTAIGHACWGGAPVGELVVLYDRLYARPLRERLLFGLAARTEDGAVEKLARVARADPDPSLRRTALYWLRVSRHPRAPALLAQADAAARASGEGG
ncbi:MAG TPA: hypothetical protein VLK84_27570 [Longimicrobium sp.]|nr:hypothetical protein [Longimicrobium sp.]